MSATPWQREVRDLARRFGGTIEPTRRHMRVHLPNGRTVFCSSTPSDRNAIRNVKRDIERAMKGAP